MKKQLLPLLALLSIPVAHADEINLQALQACTFIENDFNRLLCYDNVMAGKPLSKPAAATQSLQNTSPVPVTAIANTTKIKNEDFGLEHKEIAKENDDKITAAVSSIKEAPYGELIINLENGQQWRQIGSDSMRLEKTDTVVISRGVFNSFLLVKYGQKRSIRVKRTK
ncbi:MULTISPECIES: hypothetical protein [Pseudoalteromonas]|jgi:hypothetical protein|uniref:Type IV pilus biogenesis protein PilP n=1 Tax=Pseudoalteromonas aliena SW19 TaxID=1314866 RepID=A0ABR9E2V7_9GAMM|nr:MULTISPECIES: hypothetical protein [Pseudoalteromonas]MBE0360932.1 hypothetical protein [Pseudoalteromonas aliena SW19]